MIKTTTKHASCALAALLISSSALAQQAWKVERPVEIITGSAAGNSIDRMARMVQRMLQEKKLVDTPVAVLNKPGGGNTIAWNYLNSRAGDGHYLMVANFNLSAGHLTGTTPYSYRDFTPICIMFHEYVAFAVRADSPIRDAKDDREAAERSGSGELRAAPTAPRPPCITRGPLLL